MFSPCPLSPSRSCLLRGKPSFFLTNQDVCVSDFLQAASLCLESRLLRAKRGEAVGAGPAEGQPPETLDPSP